MHVFTRIHGGMIEAKLQLQAGFSMLATVTELGLRIAPRHRRKKLNLLADSDG